MTRRHALADHVGWNSEAGHVCATLIAVHTGDLDAKGHVRRASQHHPRCEIRSDKTVHVAAPKGGALRLL